MLLPACHQWVPKLVPRPRQRGQSQVGCLLPTPNLPCMPVTSPAQFGSAPCIARHDAQCWWHPCTKSNTRGSNKGCALPAGSGESPASEGPLPGSAWRTWHDNVNCETVAVRRSGTPQVQAGMLGGTASPSALLAVAQTAQQQEDSAEDGSKGDRLPGAAGDAETGTVDSRAAVRTAGGDQRLEHTQHGAEVRAHQATLICAERLEGGSLAAVIPAELLFSQEAARTAYPPEAHCWLHDAPWMMLKLLGAQALAMLGSALPTWSPLVSCAGHPSTGGSRTQA